MKVARRTRAAPTINLSPLIDVIFILLVFVVLVAKFADQERLDVDVPSAQAGRPAELDALMIELDADGGVWLQGEAVGPEALLDGFRGFRRSYHRAVLVADRQVDLQLAVDVISAAKLAGFDGVAVATRPPDEP
ncbi:MAG: biopolymer transporter ExbD [Myxococcota bacterium]